jgi:hypothetical protein
VEDLRRFPTWEKASAKGYLIYKYEVTAEVLTLWSSQSGQLEKAVKAGNLKGKWEGGPYYSYLRITDTTANLARFLASEEGDRLFSKDGVLKRVK